MKVGSRQEKVSSLSFALISGSAGVAQVDETDNLLHRDVGVPEAELLICHQPP